MIGRYCRWIYDGACEADVVKKLRTCTARRANYYLKSDSYVIFVWELLGMIDLP